MNYWQIILEEVEHYEDRGFRCLYSNLQETDIFVEKIENEYAYKAQRKPKVTYPLTGNLSHLHLTEREAECIYCLQHHHTIKSTGILLNLSSRTVEFYLKNIKTKMQVRTKDEVLSNLGTLNFNDYPIIHDALAELLDLCEPIPKRHVAHPTTKLKLAH